MYNDFFQRLLSMALKTVLLLGGFIPDCYKFMSFLQPHVFFLVKDYVLDYTVIQFELKCMLSG